MKKIFKIMLLGCTAFLINYAYAMQGGASPVGYWKTIDDVTGKPKAIIEIYESNNALFGKVVKIWPKPGADQNELCEACTGSRHNKRIVGMVILEDLKQDKNKPTDWSDGSILDPSNGKTYHCNIKVSSGGQKLNVRGYIGMPLFGRTQTWLQVNGPNAD